MKAWITGTLAEDVLGLVVGLEKYVDVWLALAAAFAQNLQAREFELFSKLQLLKKGMSHLSDYLHEFKSICDELNGIGKPVPGQSKVFWLLNGLGPSYESFTTTMVRPPVPTYDAVIPLLQSHELHSKGHQNLSVNPSMAFYGQKTSGGNKKGENKFSSKGRGFPQIGQKSPLSPPH